jgi:hypothetical protein
MRGFIATAPTYAQNLAGSAKSRISLCIDFLRIWARQGFHRKFYLSRLMRINPWILSPSATRIPEVEEQTPPDLSLPPLPTGRGRFLLSQVDRGRANSETAKASPRTLDVSNPGRSQTPGTRAALALGACRACPPTTETDGRLARNKLNISWLFVNKSAPVVGGYPGLGSCR